MEYYRLVLYVLFGVLPSLIWLFYYLRKDLHPEPKAMIVKMFLYGMAVTIPALFLEIGLSETLNETQYLAVFYSPEISPYLPMIMNIVRWFLVIALVEEVCKYLAVKLFLFHNDALDEPLDLMLYMVIGALGFTALENILYLFSPIDGLSFDVVIKTAVTISFMRFVGATFLHTLCSALIGYFMALSSLRNKHRFRLTVLGIFLATLLHGLYDFSIITLHAPLNFLIPLAVIIMMAVFIFYDFDEIKKVKSICKL